MTTIPDALFQRFQQLTPLVGLLWYVDQGTACCIIKVPQYVRFDHLWVMFYTPRGSYQPVRASSNQENMRIVLPFGVQIAPEQPYSNQTQVFYLSNVEDRHLVEKLAQARRLLLLGYSSTSTPQYLGTKQLPWAKSKRRTLRQWLDLTMPSALPATFVIKSPQPQAVPVPKPPRPQATPSPKHPEPHVQQKQAEHAQWSLPVGARKAFTSSLMRGLLTLPEEVGEAIEAIPRIYVKVPPQTRFQEVAIAFGSLTLTHYPAGWVLSLSLHLQDTDGHVLLADAICDPISKPRLLRALASTTVVEMVALADTSAFPVLGAKQLDWSTQKRERAQTLGSQLKKGPPPRGSWKQVRTAYLQEHYQDHVFQTPLPKPPQQRDVTEQAIISAQRPQRENIPSPNTAKQEQSAPPASVVQAAEEVYTERAARPTPLIEQFVLLHRAGVHEEYRRTHTLSRRLFWRMLLSLALEQTPRKFLWTPEAVQITETHREQLAPGSMVPWLASREHLWIAFAEPIATPTCAETAALFVFSAVDASLLPAFAQQVRASSHTLKALERDLYAPEKQRVSMGMVNRAGAIVWSISLKTDMHGESSSSQGAWTASPWYTCSSEQCSLHTQGAATLCERCAATRTFIWTWLVACWQSLLGLYRATPGEERPITSRGEERIEHVSRALPGRDEHGMVQRIDLDYRYRVVRSIDIANVSVSTEREGIGQRGSWVEALSSIDPSLVFYDEREVPLRTRTLRHPRYSKYIEQHGTNQVEVRPHMRHVPMRSDPKAITKVTAKHAQKDSQGQ